MSRRLPGMQFVLPAVVDPPRVCTTIQVPDDLQHIAAFLGAIRGLGSAYNWKNDSAHTAKLVAAVWRNVFDGIVVGNCSIGASGDMQFRQSGCKLQFSVDCVNWITLYDPTECIHEIAGQPGPSGPVAPGDCTEFDVTLQANQQWLMPTTITDGSTIEISNVSGAWSDGNVNWYCPDGTPYILGQCIGLKGHAGGDPSGSLYHMAVIGVVQSGTPVYFDATGGMYTAPSGTGQQSVVFQANDSNLADNFGQVTFHVKVCNTAVVEWTHVFDFTIDDRGWVGRPSYASYAAAVGWEDTNYNLYVQTPVLAGALDLTYFKSEFTVVTPDTQTGGVINDVRTTAWTQVVELLRNNGLFETGGVLEWSGAVTVAAGDCVDFGWSAAGITTAHVRLTKITLGGTGTDPF